MITQQKQQSKSSDKIVITTEALKKGLNKLVLLQKIKCRDKVKNSDTDLDLHYQCMKADSVDLNSIVEYIWQLSEEI